MQFQKEAAKRVFFLEIISVVGGGICRYFIRKQCRTAYPFKSNNNSIVERNVSSALIMEDDQDWDLRIKDQMRDFAIAAHSLLQPQYQFAGLMHSVPASVTKYDFSDLPGTLPPTQSPYGDDWDILVCFSANQRTC